MNIRRYTTTLAALVLAILVAAGIAELVDDDGDNRPDRIVIPLRGQDAQPLGVPVGPDRLTLNERGIDVLEDAKANDAGGHIGADDEVPATVPAAKVIAGVRQQERLAASDRLPDLTPLAAPSQAGCSTRLVGNYSSRNGVRPRIIVAHYTVSPNRPGRADVDGITAYFNNRGSSASSHYVVDADGNCNLIVRETSKAWTQATFNPVAISIESIATGRERDLANPAGYAKLGRIVRDAGRRWAIPIRRGAVSGCTVTRPGIVDHKQLGGCGGGHTDVRPFDVAKVIRAASSSSTASKLTKVERRLANRRCYHRARHLARKGAARRADLKWSRYYVRRLRARVAAIPGQARSRPARRATLGRYITGTAC